MNDSRVDRVANTIREAQVASDPVEKLGLVEYAAEEWAGFADEFPATDLVIAVVTRRLDTAAKHLAANETAIAGLSLQVASNAAKAVQQR